MIVNPIYNRRDNEEKYEYGLRLITEKVEKNPSDLDWADIVEALNLNCHRDSLRKAAATTEFSGYSVMKYFKQKYAGVNKETDLYLDELELKTMELKKERQRLFDQRRELNKILTVVSRREFMDEQLQAAALTVNKTVPLSFRKQIAKSGIDEAIVVFADWHYGMSVENVWQKYNCDECRRRVEALVSSIASKLILHKPNRTHIVILGDMAHGAIHTSARVASEELVCEQLMQVSEILAQAINEIANHCEIPLWVRAMLIKSLIYLQTIVRNKHGNNGQISVQVT